MILKHDEKSDLINQFYPNATSNIIIIINPNVNQSVEEVLWFLLDSGISSLTQVAIIAPAEKLSRIGNIELI